MTERILQKLKEKQEEEAKKKENVQRMKTESNRKPSGASSKKEMTRNMTVTIAHSKTPIEELRRLVEHADVIISAVGKELPVQTMHSRAIAIIDVGMNRDRDGKLCGDLTEDWKQNNSMYYTPVPGGVGPMTVCMLMSNVVSAYSRNVQLPF